MAQIARGGFWRFLADSCLPTKRIRLLRHLRDDDLGFRLAKREYRSYVLRGGARSGNYGRNLCCSDRSITAVPVSRHAGVGFRISRRNA